VIDWAILTRSSGLTLLARPLRPQHLN
jgi:hypothetical protein